MRRPKHSKIAPRPCDSQPGREKSSYRTGAICDSARMRRRTRARLALRILQ